MAEQPKTPPDGVHVLMLGHEQLRKVPPSNTRVILLGGVLGIVVVFSILAIVLILTLHNPGSSARTQPIVHPSQTSKCTVHEMMQTFYGSEDYCKSRNSRLLNEEDTKVASLCVTRGEDFWAAPMSRNYSECFIYNTDYGFVRMDCLTPRWFICLGP